MLDPRLEALLCAVDSGSFTKAAELLYMSPTAVMKRVDSLEADLNLKLIERSHRGIRLTPGGEVLCSDARLLRDYARRSVERARAAMGEGEMEFRVGTSLLNPARPFMDLWYRVSGQFPGFKLQLVPFEDDHETILGVIDSLGERFDLIIGVCDSKLWLERCSMLPLGRYKKLCAVSREHRLASKELLVPEDLHGETLMMVPEGDSAANDAIRASLQREHPEIKLEDTTRFYDITVFNRCANTGNVLLSLECWRDVHPALVSLPVAWDYDITCGLMYAKNPSEKVRRLVRELEKIVPMNAV